MKLPFFEPLTLFHQDGKAVLMKEFVNTPLLTQITEEITLSEERIIMYGKEVTVPRLTAYQGEQDYTYSGNTYFSSPFTKTIQELKKKIEEVTNHDFNSVLFNWYKNGHDYMGYHRDNEPEMDTSLIASLSFGAARKFKFKHIESKQTIDVLLENGDLLLMYNCQHYWQHALPKALKVNEQRLNLTFRKIKEKTTRG